MNRKKLASLLLVLLALAASLFGLSGRDAAPAGAGIARQEQPVQETNEPIIAPQAIADYLFACGRLPDNFITKQEAQALGWDSAVNDVSDVAPGKSIGGDRFGNYEGVLPTSKGVTYREADANYVSGSRGAERVVFSSDGRVYYTNDHYASFTQLYPSGQNGENE